MAALLEITAWPRRRPPSATRIGPSRRPSSTSSAPPSTDASTPAATSTSTTPAEPVRGVAGRGAPAGCCATASTATRTQSTRPRRRRRSSSSSAGGGAALLQRARERVRVHLHAERHGRAAARRRGLSVRPGGRFLATFDNHNSVNGIRQFARAKGRDAYVPVEAPDLRVARLADHLDEADGHSLFAYPAQSNFSGVKHPLEWIDLAHERAGTCSWTARVAPTSRLDLSEWRPTSSRCRSTRCSATRPAWAR